MPPRYDMRRDSDTSWTVFDIETEEPVIVKNKPMTDLDMDDADEVVTLLNSQNRRERPETRV